MNPILASSVTGTAAPVIAPPPAETPVGFASVLGLVLKPAPGADGRSATDPGNAAGQAPAPLTETAGGETPLDAGTAVLPDPDVNGAQVSAPSPMALLQQLRGLRAAQEASAATGVAASAADGHAEPAAASPKVLPQLPAAPVMPKPGAAPAAALVDGEGETAPAAASSQVAPQLAALPKPDAATVASDEAAVPTPASNGKGVEGGPSQSSTAAPTDLADADQSGDAPLNADPAASASAGPGFDPLALGLVVVAPPAATQAAAAPSAQSPAPGVRQPGTLRAGAAEQAQAARDIAAAPAGKDEARDARTAETDSTQASGLTENPGEAQSSAAPTSSNLLDGKVQAVVADPAGKALELSATAAYDFNASALNHLQGHAAHGIPGPAAGDAAGANTPTLSTPVPVDADLPEALGERVLMLSEAGVSSARIELHPAELGSLVVRIEVHQDQAQVAFSADNPATRSLLQQAMPQLRELFGAQGLQLLRARVEERQRDAGSSSGSFTQTRARGEAPAVRRIGRIRLVDAYV